MVRPDPPVPLVQKRTRAVPRMELVALPIICSLTVFWTRRDTSHLPGDPLVLATVRGIGHPRQWNIAMIPRGEINPGRFLLRIAIGFRAETRT